MQPVVMAYVVYHRLNTVPALLVSVCLLRISSASGAGSLSTYSFGRFNMSRITDNSSYNSFTRIAVCTVSQEAQLLLRLSRNTTRTSQFTIQGNATFDYTVSDQELSDITQYAPDKFAPLHAAFTISSDSNVQVFVEQLVPGTAGGYLAFPVTENSTEFFVASRAGHEAAVMATSIFPNTEVNFYNVTGDAYSPIGRYFLADGHMSAALLFNETVDSTGIFVNSTKPISVTVGIPCGNVPNASVAFCDFMAEQIPPVSELGTVYIVPPIIGRRPTAGYLVRVVATRLNTTVVWMSNSRVNPSSPQTLTRGQFVEIDVPYASLSLVIVCSEPCLVMQYNKGRMAPIVAEIARTDPFMMLTTPEDHFVSATCFSTAKLLCNNNMAQAETYLNYISLIARGGGLLDVVVDGVNLYQPLNDSSNGVQIQSTYQWHQIGDYLVASAPISDGSHYITVKEYATAKFAAYVYGHAPLNSSCSTGYGFTATYSVAGTYVEMPRVSPETPSNASFVQVILTDSSPLFGPAAGGTKLTITGQNLNYSSSLTVVMYSAADQQTLTATQDSRNYSHLVSVTQPYDSAVNRTTGTSFRISLQFGDGPTIETGRYFEYRGNPIIEDIHPLSHPLTGGTVVTVTGNNLDSVADPWIAITVVVTDLPGGNSTATLNLGPCSVENSTNLKCLMPAVPLPDNFRKSLENGTVASSVDGSNSSSLLSDDGRQKADIHVGLVLDGFTQYNDLTESMGGAVQFTFKRCQPQIQSSSTVFEVQDGTASYIDIKGSSMQPGCLLTSYRVTVGQSQCTCTTLTDNQLTCQLPAVKPHKFANDTFCAKETLALLVYVDTSDPYLASCIRYNSPGLNTDLIIGLAVGIGGGVLLIITIIIVIVVCVVSARKRRQRAKKPDVDDHQNIPAAVKKTDEGDVINTSVPHYPEPGPKSGRRHGNTASRQR